MTRYEQFTSMSIEDLAKWINDHGQFDDSPWMKWFDEKYCSKCESVFLKRDEQKEKLGFEALYNINMECAYCETHEDCRFFPRRPSPSIQEIILMWLKETVANEEKK